MIAKLIAGDHHTFTLFYEEHVSSVYAFFFSKTRSEADSKDLTQQAFIKLWDYRLTLDERIPIEAQLFQKARQLYIDWLRKQAHQRETINKISSGGEQSEDPFKNEKVQLIREASEMLPDRQKKIFELHYVKGYSYKEISGLLKISPKTVDSHLYTALKQIRKLI